MWKQEIPIAETRNPDVENWKDRYTTVFSLSLFRLYTIAVQLFGLLTFVSRYRCFDVLVCGDDPNKRRKNVKIQENRTQPKFICWIKVSWFQGVASVKLSKSWSSMDVIFCFSFTLKKEPLSQWIMCRCVQKLINAVKIFTT